MWCNVMWCSVLLLLLSGVVWCGVVLFSVMRKVKGGPGVGFLKILVRCPSLIWWYNKGMGGIQRQASAASAAEWASAWNPKMASVKAAGSCFILSR